MNAQKSNWVPRRPGDSRQERGRIMAETGCVLLPKGQTSHDIADHLRQGGYVLVRSWTDDEVYYQVNGQCTCPDWQKHGEGHWCKHRQALRFALQTLRQQEKEKAAPAAPGRCPDCGGRLSGPTMVPPFGKYGKVYWGLVCPCGYLRPCPEPTAAPRPEPPPEACHDGIDWSEWRTPEQIEADRQKALQRRGGGVHPSESTEPTSAVGAVIAGRLNGENGRRLHCMMA